MEIFKTKEYAEMPAFQTKGAACFDVKAAFEPGEKIRTWNALNKEILIPAKPFRGKVGIQLPPLSRALIPTGLIFDVPDNHVLEMFVRSSVATKKGLNLCNGIGVIDSDYVEESYIALHNISDSLVVIESGERLAQCRLSKLIKTELVEVDTRPSQKTDRNGGFGSTG